MSWFKFKNNFVASSVYTKETDLSTSSNIGFNSLIVGGKSEKAPINESILLFPKTKPVKWYQFWRYSDKKKYAKEAEECRIKFYETFGKPN